MSAVKQISPDDFVDRGTLRSAAVITANPRELHFQLEQDHDDLDAFEAAYFQVNGRPVVVQRYARNPQHEYTVSVDLGTLPLPPAEARQVVKDFCIEMGVRSNVVKWLSAVKPA